MMSLQCNFQLADNKIIKFNIGSSRERDGGKLNLDKKKMFKDRKEMSYYLIFLVVLLLILRSFLFSMLFYYVSELYFCDKIKQFGVHIHKFLRT